MHCLVCAGWWTGQDRGYTVVNGQRSRTPCREDFLWHQGDTVQVTLDCRKSCRPHMTLLNTHTGVHRDITVTAAGSGTTDMAARHVAAATTSGAGGSAATGAGGADGKEGLHLEGAAGECEWVLIVGLTVPGDKIRIHTAKRKGMRLLNT